MTEQQLDQLWQQAMRESIEAGEQFTRYRFAALVAAHAKAEERERCAQVCAKVDGEHDWVYVDAIRNLKD